MTAAIAPFGTLSDGGRADEILLSGGGLEVRVLTYGATIRDLLVTTAGGPRSVVLGMDSLGGYAAQTAYFGCVAGRCANRIAGGRFELGGRQYQLDLNEAGRTHLHGGSLGFSRRLWTVEDASAEAVTLSLVSPDGEMGYPGTVRATCRYAIAGDGRLSITLEAETDAPTLVNLATHSYFTLDDEPTILDHLLEIPADHYTPVDGLAIPTGEIAPVGGTRFDFRRARPVARPSESLIDHNLALYDAPSPELRPMARLASERTGLSLAIHSTEPGLQVYDGQFLTPDLALSHGRRAVRHAGICLEPQRFPDAIHHPAFPGSVLVPGERYRQVTEYRLAGG